MLDFMLGEYEKLIRDDTQFAEFVKDNENKTIEDIAKEFDIDLKILSRILS